MKPFLVNLALLLASLVRAMHNVTVDDSDLTMINYNPPPNWDADSYQQSPLDYHGSHTVSVDPTATATFTFFGKHASAPRLP